MKKYVKVNIGSGPHGMPDWINLDWGILPLLSKFPFILYLVTRLRILPNRYYMPWPSNPKLCDCRKSLPFKDKSVDFIYTSHFIEHLSRYQAVDLLNECKRILTPTGVLRISVPDLKILTEKYLSNDIPFFKRMIAYDQPEANLKNIADLYVQHFYGYDTWAKTNFLQKIRRRLIRGHLWMYDFESLSDILKEIGFKRIKRLEHGKGEVPEIEYLDIHKENSLYIEASL